MNCPDCGRPWTEHSTSGCPDRSYGSYDAKLAAAEVKVEVLHGVEAKLDSRVAELEGLLRMVVSGVQAEPARSSGVSDTLLDRIIAAISGAEPAEVAHSTYCGCSSCTGGGDE